MPTIILMLQNYISTDLINRLLKQGGFGLAYLANLLLAEIGVQLVVLEGGVLGCLGFTCQKKAAPLDHAKCLVFKEQPKECQAPC